MNHLKPLFSFIEKKIDQELDEWGGEIELMLKDRHRLIYCQGATLDVENKNLRLRYYYQRHIKAKSCAKKGCLGRGSSQNGS